MRCIWNGMDNLTVVTVVSQPGMRFANQRLQATFCFIGKVSPFWVCITSYIHVYVHIRAHVHTCVCTHVYMRTHTRTRG